MSPTLAEIPLAVSAVDRLEREVASSSDSSLRALLVETLADRYRWVGLEKDLERLRFHLAKLPRNAQDFGLAFIAAHEDDCAGGKSHFLRYVQTLIAARSSRPDADFAWQLYLRYLGIVEFFPAGSDIDLQTNISDMFLKRCPNQTISVYESSQSLIMRGDLREARRKLVSVLTEDPAFWIASYDLALVHALEGDWKNAGNRVRKLLDRDIVRRDPMLCYQAACFLIKAGRDAEAARAIGYYLDILERASDRSCPPSSDAIMLIDSHLSMTFGVDETVEKSFADLLLNEAKKRWKESAYLLYLFGEAAWVNKDAQGALRYFADADDRDHSFWSAAVSAGQLSASEDNWHSAASWYRRALQCDSARNYPSVWFEAAWCFGKIRSHGEEIEGYRRCLQCYPKFVFGKNNLGYALFKAGKLREAEAVLRESLKLEVERPYAVWNLAKVLVRFGRLREAIGALGQDVTASGRISATAAREITRLERILESEPASTNQALGNDEVSPEGGSGTQSHRGSKRKPGSEEEHQRSPTERLLEGLIEQKIRRGDEVFMRRLRVYGGCDQLYGRQFPVPGVGIIDLLAEDTESGDLVVIELKKGRATAEIIEQIRKYVTWVEENLAKPGQKVVPIICLHSIDERLRDAAEEVGIEVFEYDLSFRRRENPRVRV